MRGYADFIRGNNSMIDGVKRAAVAALLVLAAACSAPAPPAPPDTPPAPPDAPPATTARGLPGRAWWGRAPTPSIEQRPTPGRPGRPGYPMPRPWAYRPGMTWQWQLTGSLDLSVDADVYELDAFTTPATAVDALHAAGRKVICYVSAGAYEHFRPDAGRYPPSVLGAANGWPGERWLDIRQWPTLEPVLRDRFRLCADKGFDAVEADNVDGYANDSGYPLTADDQLLFNRRVARLAHALGLAIGLKNDLDQVAALEPEFDFAVNEECFRYGECGRLAPFTAAGKPVFHVEYDVDVGRFCAQTTAMRLVSMRKRPDLDAWRQPC